MIASMDIFETVLTRRVGNPEGLFWILGRRLFKQGLFLGTPENYARCRIEAEMSARKNAPEGEPTLEEIYDAFIWLTGVGQTASRALMTAELALEEDFVCEVPGARRVIEDILERVRSLTFLSDMYLPSSFLKRCLVSKLGLSETIDVMVSCEWRASKRSGALFHRLFSAKSVTANDVLHIGNDPIADLEMPLRLGIRATLVDRANLNRYEAQLETFCHHTGGLTSIYAGASRVARLSVMARDHQQAALRDMTAGAVAPALVAYIVWVLGRANALGLKRLYFISRDGQLLLSIADRIARAGGTEIDLRYLYGSRQAWHLPALGLRGSLETNCLVKDEERSSVESVFMRLGLSCNDFAQSLKDVGLPRSVWPEPINDDSRKSVDRLFRTESLRSSILQKSEHARTALLEYLKQEGLTDSIPAGLVDLGWTGNMFDSLWTVLRTKRKEPVIGFLYGLIGHTSSDPFQMPKEGFIVDSHRKQGNPYATQVVGTMLELFCAGTHGMVTGYEKHDGSITPQTKEALTDSRLDLDIPTIRTTVHAFLDSLALNGDSFEPSGMVREATNKTLLLLRDNPTQTEAAVLGSRLHSYGQTESHFYAFAEPYPVSCAIRALLGRSLRAYPTWHGGSLALTSASARCAIKLAFSLRRAIGQLKRRFQIVSNSAMSQLSAFVTAERRHSPNSVRSTDL